MSKTARIRLAALVAAAVAGLVGLVALALRSSAAGALTATYSRVQEWPGWYFQGQYLLANGTSAGDSFTTSGNNLSLYGAKPGNDPNVTVSGSTVSWGSHLPEAAAAGVVAILFGAGTGTGTEGVPEVPRVSQTAPTDYGYWMARAQQYLAAPVPLP